jgi:glycosyltransferase involved in cell wall biosynthesis
MKSKITFCLPVYNEERFLWKSVQSILAQSEKDCLVYISDNASTDQTPFICEALSSSDSRVKYVRQSRNIGASANFLFLIHACVTEYICFMGAHDLIAISFLASLMPYFQECPNACLVYSQMSSIDAIDAITNSSCGDSIDTRNCSLHAAAWMIQNQLYGNMVYGIYRTEVLRLCHHNIISRGPDHILIQELSLLGSIIHHSEPLYFMRDMTGINRSKSMSYDDFCCSQLVRIDPTFFSRGPRRVHWHWLYTTLSVMIRANASLSNKIQAIPAAFLGFIYRWRRQLLREIIKPLRC